jgi:hypothetical protein
MASRSIRARSGMTSSIYVATGVAATRGTELRVLLRSHVRGSGHLDAATTTGGSTGPGTNTGDGMVTITYIPTCRGKTSTEPA